MKFLELSKSNQNILIELFEIQIDYRAEEEGIDDVLYPTIDEYTSFFDEYDQDYELIDGYPESTIEQEYHPRYSIDFDENGKTILRTFDYDDERYDYSNEEYYEDGE